MNVLPVSRPADSTFFTCMPHEMLPAMALGRIAAAHVLLDVAEGSPRIRHHPLFDSAQRVFEAMSREPNLDRPGDPEWEEARSQLEALGRRLHSHMRVPSTVGGIGKAARVEA